LASLLQRGNRAAAAELITSAPLEVEAVEEFAASRPHPVWAVLRYPVLRWHRV
jgi:hypothetical protein